MGKWIVCEENPAIGMRAIVDSNGAVIAFCPNEKHANMIARIPTTAIVKFALGRYRLEVNGIIVAMEGDPIRDSRIVGDRWDGKSLVNAAKIINGLETITDEK